MESANLHHHHHQLQDQLVSSSSLSNPSWYVAASNHHAWTPNTNTLNNGNRNENNDEENLCNSRVQKNDILVPPSVAPSSSSSSSSSSMIQDLGFQYWTSSNNTAGSHEQKDHFNDDEKLLLNTLSSSAFQISGDQFQYGLTYMPSRGNVSQIFPSINISNLSAARSISSEISSSFAINLEALDLLTSARFSENFSESSHDNLGLVEESPSFASHHMHQSRQKPPSSPNYTISPFINGVTETKRLSNTIMEPKSSQAAAKKSRLETRACAPFKVRKEKLGDRIAALQQLVAPFGKTDTASVLMEAIGYIKFLQNQVETLSVPYMKSARNKTHRTPQPGQTEGDGDEEPKRDLKSRGLCLVPLSCMSYVTNDGGGGGVIWPHDGYHGCT